MRLPVDVNNADGDDEPALALALAAGAAAAVDALLARFAFGGMLACLLGLAVMNE